MVKKYSYVGGSTTDITYDFFNKIAGSTTNCPLKIYENNIDLAATIPAPTDVSWTEITSQTKLDRLKAQNYTPISTSVNQTDYTITYNGVTYDDNLITVVDDFAGKVSGSTTVNPNLFRYYNGTNLTTFASLAEYSQIYLDKIKTLDGNGQAYTQATSGYTPQQILSFNLVRIIEDKFGEIPATDKIAWLKSNVKKLSFNWYGNGSSYLGNHCKLARYNNTNSTWYSSASWENTASSPALIANRWGDIYLDGQSFISDAIDSSGFAHLLAYTDSACTTSSILLVLANSYNLVQFDTVEDVTRSSCGLVSQGYTDRIVMRSDYGVAGMVAGDTVNIYKSIGITTAGTGTTDTVIKITNHGLTGTYAYVRSSRWGWTSKKVQITDVNTLTLLSPVTGLVQGDSIDKQQYLGQGTAGSGVISSTVNTDYVSIEVTLKCPNNYGTTNPMTSNYVGKITGSTTENPNKMYSTISVDTPSLQIPSSSDWVENVQTRYDSVATLNGSCSTISRTANGAIGQMYFAFDLIKIVESKIGYSIPSTDKVTWLKNNILSTGLTFKWYGYGSNPTGNKAYIKPYYTSDNTWHDWGFYHTASTPTLITMTTGAGGVSPLIDSNGFVYLIAHTDTSNGTIASSISTDYVEVVITLKSNRLLTPANNRRDGTKGDILIVNEQDFTVKKFFDGASIEMSASVTSKAKAMLIEIDMTSVATNLFGGSNSVLNNAISSFSFYTYFRGSGSYNGVNTYGSRCEIWVNNSNKWAKSGNNWGTDVYQDNNGNAISKVTITPGVGGIHQYLTSSNKIYFALYTLYPSDGTIPSVLDIDYSNMKISLARSVDAIPAKPVTLPSEWTLIIKGVAQPWVAPLSYTPFFITLYKDDSNQIQIRNEMSGSSLFLAYRKDSTTTTYTTGFGAKLDTPYLVKNIAIVKTPSQLKMHCLANGSTVETQFANVSMNDGLYNMFIGENATSVNQSNSLFQSISFISKALTDNEAIVTLKGRNTVDINNNYLTAMAKTFESPNMIDISDRYGQTNAPYTQTGSTVTITNNHASNLEQYYAVNIPRLLPNNRYVIEFDYDSVGSTELFVLNNPMTYRQVIINNNITAGTNQKFSATFTLDEKDVRSASQYIRFDTNNNAASLTIRNLSLRRYD